MFYLRKQGSPMLDSIFSSKLIRLIFIVILYSNSSNGEIPAFSIENNEWPPLPIEKSTAEDSEEKLNEVPSYLIPLKLGACGNITFEPGFRVQIRYNYDTNSCNHDIFIRRFRLQCSGNAFGIARYYGELKIDNVGKYKSDPRAEIENAWIDFTLCKNVVYLLVGMYDVPVSRDALTSDARLLFMDRTLIKEKLSSLGLADSTVGLLFHGRPYNGHFEYAVGIFDNLTFEMFDNSEAMNSRQLMPGGRLVINFLDPAEPPDGYDDYEGSYIGAGERLALGINGAYLGGAKNKGLKFNLYVAGADLFYNTGPFTFQTEYDAFSERNKKGYGWYVQSGYLLCCWLEMAVRYQELMPISRDKVQCSSIGLNIYIRKQNLKIQSDYTYKSKKHRHVNNHIFETQLQFDY